MRAKLSSYMVIQLTFVLLLGACGLTSPAEKDLILATTTSTQDSGLLDVLIPLFEEQTGYIVKVVAVGTGQALTMGQEGNADVLLVHAPASEKEFMANGFGAERYLVMHNDFVIVGPPSDPDGIQGFPTAIEAFQHIQASSGSFISRGDDSGTHKMELALWEKAGVSPDSEAYLESGQGMGATLTIASEKSAYTLTDRATYLAMRENLQLEILVEGDAALLNVYHVMTVNPQKWPEVNVEGAKDFAEFMVSDETQAIIAEFGVKQYGQPLFFPDAHQTEADLGLE